jgi:hypothetical protein
MQNNLDKNKIKEVIRKHEMIQTQTYRLSGNWVDVVNVRVKKNEILADVIMKHEDGFDRFNSVIYPKSMFKMEVS